MPSLIELKHLFIYLLQERSGKDDNKNCNNYYIIFYLSKKD